jgi:hypothetical protein
VRLEDHLKLHYDITECFTAAPQEQALKIKNFNKDLIDQYTKEFENSQIVKGA